MIKEIHYKIIFVVLWLVYVLIRVPHDNRYKKFEKKVVVNPLKERLLIFILFLGMVLIPMVWVFSNWVEHFSLSLPAWLRFTGIVISILSLWLFWKVHKELGTNWSPTLEIRKQHSLVTKGLYSRMRHPMYAQIWVWVVAQGLVISNLIASVAGILAWAILYQVRVRKEENMLRKEFGDQYDAYIRETWSIFPKPKS